MYLIYIERQRAFHQKYTLFVKNLNMSLSMTSLQCVYIYIYIDRYIYIYTYYIYVYIYIYIADTELVMYNCVHNIFPYI